jgi:mRNA-degrading endonuclease RelE of RelBE toxin-antitoxin system
MLFIETPVFTRQLRELLPDDEYRNLQLALLLRPEAGPIIPGGSGLRKIRWGLAGRGKRGGMRIIYYWDKAKDCIYMLLVYPKNRQEDLTQEQLRTLRNLVKENLK